MNKQESKIFKFILPTFGNIIWMAAFFGVLIRGRRMMNADGDLARHLALGRYILDTQRAPLRDVFSHTMTGEAMTPHEWITQVLFAFAERIFDYEGVILLCALVISTTIWLVFKHIRGEIQAIIPTVLVAILVLLSSMVHWLARPHIFTFLMLACWMMILDQLRMGHSKHWWILPLIMLLWANLHGAFIAGFVTWIIYGIGTYWDALLQTKKNDPNLPVNFWRNYFFGGVTSFAVTLINPSGFNLWKTSVGYLGNRYLVDRTIEYQSPNFHDVKFWPFLILIGILVIILGFSKRKPTSARLLNAAAWLMMGLYSARNIPLFAIVSAPLLAQSFEDWMTNSFNEVKIFERIKDSDFRLRELNEQLKGYFWPLVSVIIAVAVLSLGINIDLDRKGYGFDPDVFPVEAVDWLKENPQEGEMFNYFSWGGYLLYRLWPQEKVFIDAQTDFYGENLTRQYADVIFTEDGWQNVLEKYSVTWAILPVNEPCVDAFKSELGWHAIYMDDTAVILRR